MTNRERAERWVADRTTKGFYSPTTTDSLTALLDEATREAFDRGVKSEVESRHTGGPDAAWAPGGGSR